MSVYNSFADLMMYQAFWDLMYVLDAVGLKSSRDEIRSQAYTQAILSYCYEHNR